MYTRIQYGENDTGGDGLRRVVTVFGPIPMWVGEVVIGRNIEHKRAHPGKDERVIIFSGTIARIMEETIRTLEELKKEAADFVGALVPSAQGATLVTLSGELGAGKTAFTKAAANALGIEEIVTSPTFVLEKIYLLPRKLGGFTAKFTRLIHIDAYRLEQGSDLAPLGFDELMRDSGNLILLEWPEKVIDRLPNPSKKLSFTVQSDGSRTISYG